MDRDKLEEFILQVFNYYNGRINTRILATLEIDWTIRSNFIGGDHICPNHVRVFPSQIHNFILTHKCINQKTVEAYIIEIIIHELYHVDQLIMYSQMQNYEYNKYIEYNVEFMTISYIECHKQEIYELFGIDMESYALTINNYAMPTLYKRCFTDNDFIITIADRLLGLHPDKQHIIASMVDILYNNYDIIFILNNNAVNMKINNITDKTNISNLIYEYFTKYDYTVINYVNYEINNSKFILTIKYKSYNNMISNFIDL